MKAIVLVTPELFPFTAGGIGRVLYNMLLSMSQQERDRTFVITVNITYSASEFESLFPGVRFIPRDDNSHLLQCRAGEDPNFLADNPPGWAYTDTVWHWRSALVLNALQHLEYVGTDIGYVEFPDWGGLAFCTCQEKLISGFLENATVAVRLHSGTATLCQYESQNIELQTLCQIDLERKSLRDCDLLLGQIEAPLGEMQKSFAIPAREWDARLRIHTPPVLIDAPCATEACAAHLTQSILFTSKIQPLKAPEIFVKGVVQFMRDNPSYRGTAIICAHHATSDGGRKLKRLVPAELMNRFEFRGDLPGSARNNLIAHSTVVIPSHFESFCLAAYEASLLGGRVILNGGNPAFGEGTLWEDEVNCIKFSGTPDALAESLYRAFFQTDKLRPVKLPNGTSPWIAFDGQKGKRRKSQEGARPLVSVVIAHFNMATWLTGTLLSLLDQSYANLEIVIVDDCSTEYFSQLVIARLHSSGDKRIKVIQLPSNVGLPAARNHGIEACSGKYVLTLDADDLIKENFVELGVHALENNDEYDFVVPQTAFFADIEGASALNRNFEIIDYAMFLGEAQLAGKVANRFSTATAFFRRCLFEDYRYNAKLSLYEDWHLYRTLVGNGIRCLVTNGVYFYYRRRRNSMVHRGRSLEEEQVARMELLRLSADCDESPQLTKLAIAYLISQECAIPGLKGLVADLKAEIQSTSSIELGRAEAPSSAENAELSTINEALRAENELLLRNLVSARPSGRRNRWKGFGKEHRSKLKFHVDFLNVNGPQSGPTKTQLEGPRSIDVRGWVADVSARRELEAALLFIARSGSVVHKTMLTKVPRPDVVQKFNVSDANVLGFHSVAPISDNIVGECQVNLILFYSCGSEETLELGQLDL